jgi:hypothetical protein
VKASLDFRANEPASDCDKSGAPEAVKSDDCLKASVSFGAAVFSTAFEAGSSIETVNSAVDGPAAVGLMAAESGSDFVLPIAPDASKIWDFETSAVSTKPTESAKLFEGE